MVVFDPGSATATYINLHLQQTLARMEQQDRPIDYADYAKLLRQCGDSKSLDDGKLLHSHIQSNGHNHNRFLTNHIIHMYGRCGSVEDARKVFDSMAAPNAHSWNIMITAYAQNGHIHEARCLFAQLPVLDVVTWNGMITAYSQNGHHQDALEIFFTMNHEGLRPNKVTLITILNVCSKLRKWNQGRILHDRIFDTGYLADVMVATALLDMHGKCGYTEYAKMVFDAMPGKNEVSWSAMISAYALNGHIIDARDLFRALPEWNVIAATAMVQGYALAGDLSTAKAMFDEMPWRNAISWNALMAGYAQNGHGADAVDLFRRMDIDGAQPCSVSAVIAVDACTATASIAEGQAVYFSLRECGMDSDVAVANSLVNLFVRCGKVNRAMEIFGSMRRKNVVSWTAVMIAFAQRGDVDEAMRVFYVMQAEGVEADEIAFMIILAACSHSGVLEDGLHCFNSLVMDYKIRPEMDHYLCMIDLMGRSGLLFEAEDLINTMPFEPDVVAWRILLNACEMHGKSDQGSGAAAAVELFGGDGKEKSSSAYVMLSNVWKKKMVKINGFILARKIMADEDFGDAELWAAIDTAAAARYGSSSSGGDRSIVLSSRYHQQQAQQRHPLVELPPSPQQQGMDPDRGRFVPRMAAASRSRNADAISPKNKSLKRQQSHHPLDIDGHLPVRQKQCVSVHQYQPNFSSGKVVPRDQPGQACLLIDDHHRHQNENQQPSSNVSPWSQQAAVPSSAVFRQLQDSAMAILEKGDYMMMQGKPFIRKSGWRKIAFFFSISFEIKERKIEFDQNSNVLRAEFVARASMQSGRFADGWGSCDLREKRFSKPNHDIPSTAETRAKTRACQDLLGIGEYKSGGNI